jgi:NADPH:quinone reductase-like Zn-dependent oxidoreductase/acyl carrier protein
MELAGSPASSVWQTEIGIERLPYLADHCVQGSVVVPMTAFLEMVSSAASQLSAAAPPYEVNIGEPLVLSPAETRAVQVTARDGSIEIYSRRGDAWMLHAAAKPAATAPTTQPEELASLRQRIRGERSVTAFYDSLRGRGMDFGPAFRNVSGIWTAPGEALARISSDDFSVVEDRGYRVHPALLDACLQTIAAAMDTADGGLYLPIGVESLQLPQALSGKIWSHARIRPNGIAAAGIIVGDVLLLSPDGQLVGQIRGLTLRRADANRFERLRSIDDSQHLFRPEWIAQPRANRSKPQAAQTVPDSWLILADSIGLGAALAKRLREHGKSCTIARSPQEMRAEFGKRREWEGVVYLWSLDAAGFDGLNVERLNGAQASLCGGLLELVQVLAGRANSHPPRLWLATRGAQPVAPEQDTLAVAQAPLWGMTRSLVLEHPEFRCVTIDLDPAAGATDAALLFDEIRSESEEPQVAFRAGSRFAFHLACAGAELEARRPLRLSIEARGALDSLTLQPAQRRRPGPGQVEIAVEVAGLVFRDVLNALDLYPGDPGPLGGECGGRIAAVGAGVDGLHEGDEVIAMAPGAHDGFVLADARLVIRKPARCNLEEAVTLLSSFLTASHAFEDLASVGAGDRVLIHAGAGGVGLAAIQVAQRAGAEVFATAGSDAKRAFLRALGVKHGFDSRSLDFAQQIQRVTAGQGVTVALNSLADDFVGATFSTLARGGRFVEIGKRGIWTAEQVRRLNKDISYHIVDLGVISDVHPEHIAALLARVVSAVDRGDWKPLPYRSFPFRDAVQAYRFMAQGKHIGKIVLRQDSPDVRISPHATYLVVGGLGGLGLEVANWLVKKGARQLVLTARGEASERALFTIGKMRALGAQVLVRRADVSHREEMAALFGEIARDLPPLRGVFHTAGVLADGTLLRQTWERFESVMAPKIAGAWILHELTAGLSLDYFVLFSSIAGVLGSPGQANYAAANAFEDALAVARQMHRLPAVSIDWGAWSEVGSAVSTDLTRRRDAAGIGAFTTGQALALLEKALSTGLAQVCAAEFKRPRVDRRFANGHQPKLREPELLEQLRTSAESSRATILTQYIQGVARRVLGLPPDYEMDPRQPLSELGLDSLMAVEFRNIVASAVKQSLPATMLFSYPAVDDIASYVAAELFGKATSTQPADSGSDLLNQIEDLSDADIDELLAGRIGGIE